MKYLHYLFSLAVMLLLTGCNQKDEKLLGDDILLFRGTPAWGLAKAIEASDVAKINQILDKGEISVDFREPRYGVTLLTIAVKRYKYDSMVALLDKGADPNLQETHGHETALQAAILYRKMNNSGEHDTRYVKSLIEHGADVNLYDHHPGKYDGLAAKPPLHLAAIMQSIDIAKILLGADALINARDASEFQCLATSETTLSFIYFLVVERKAEFKEPLCLYERSDRVNRLVDLVRAENMAFDNRARNSDLSEELRNSAKEQLRYGLMLKEFLISHGEDY